MALQLVDDDQVLEAALSLLDQVYEDEDVQQHVSSKKKRRKTDYNPNRARDAQHQELLTLREQVPQLENRLEKLKRNATKPIQGTCMMGLWKKLALHERMTRENAEEENRRLRDLIRENSEVTTQNVQHLLQTRQDPVECCPFMSEKRPKPSSWPYRRMYAVPIDPRDGNIFQEMAESIDAVYHQVLQVYSTDSNCGSSHATHFPTTEKTQYRSFGDKILQFEVNVVGDGFWQFFAHSLRRPTTRFYYHTDSHQSSVLASDDTIGENFGEEHRFGEVSLDIKIKQIVRRYIAADRIVFAWRAFIRPEKFKTETLSDIVYEEKGAMVIEPYENGPNKTASVVHTWQAVTLDSSKDALQSELVQELNEFVFHSCSPKQTVQSMERTLRAYSMQSV
ncbi:hypothetical protein PHMEG_00020086 [Phytophthora megakarya]|uniref:M96 mating-specific protein n=1 Tax=Phytophthora megakarya TaxID=4795 RepID=A0A225VQ90_9STRA|nr:hypothetical protein PHMEG_00020086 [Phytophthora megakarya]